MSIFVWGLITHSKVNEAEKVLTPRLVKLPGKGKFKPIFVTASTHSFYVITLCGEVFSWGSNKFGRLGLGHEDHVETPTIIGALKKVKCKKLFSQNWSAGIIDENNDCYVWGHLVKSSTPIKLEKIKATKLAFGGDFVFVLTPERKLLAKGKNGSLQCALKEIREVSNLTEVMGDKKFIDVCGGYKFGMALEDNHTLWAWGDNTYGQLGNGNKGKKNMLPVTVRIPTNKKIVQISCSLSDKYCHSAFVTEDGELYLWGSNYKGKLGTGDTKDSLIPKLCKFVKGVTRVMCGGIHNMCLVSNSIYSFGCGSDGRLGHPECEGHRYLYKEYKPRIIEPLKGKVLNCNTSYYSAIALCSK